MKRNLKRIIFILIFVSTFITIAFMTLTLTLDFQVKVNSKRKYFSSEATMRSSAGVPKKNVIKKVNSFTPNKMDLSLLTSKKMDKISLVPQKINESLREPPQNDKSLLVRKKLISKHTDAALVESNEMDASISAANRMKVKQLANESEIIPYLYSVALTRSKEDHKIDALGVEMLREDMKKYNDTNVTHLLAVTKENSPRRTKLYFFIYRAIKPSKRQMFRSMDSKLYGLVPKLSPFKKSHYKTCSVVGNSGIIRGSGCGSSIDESNFVFRCNLAPLEPHVYDAGMKSNFTTMNPSIMRVRHRGLKNKTDEEGFISTLKKYNGHVWIPCFVNNVFVRRCSQAVQLMRNVSNPKLLLGHPDHLFGTYNYWNKNRGFKIMSTGFYVLSVALQLCDEVDVYGFWPFPHIYDDVETKNVPYHYYDDLKMTSAHSLGVEFNLIYQLHRQNILRLHVQKCR